MSVKILRSIGQGSINFSYQSLYEVGKLSIFIINFLFSLAGIWKYHKQLWYALGRFFWLPLGFIALTSIFTGMVLALQSYTGFSRFSMENATAIVVVMSMTRELAPVIVGLMLSARITSSITAEISSMQVSEQLDALHSMGISVMQYIIAPYCLAVAISTPILVLVADCLGIWGGYIACTHILHFSSGQYIIQTLQTLRYYDVISGMGKGFAFGLIIGLSACYLGTKSKFGAMDIGINTCKAVVSSCMLIIILNCLLTAIFFGVGA